MTELRPALLQFALEMEKRLRDNDGKGGWQGMGCLDLCKRILQENAELDDALWDYMHPGSADARRTAAQRVIHECADQANYLMMLADVVAQGKGLPTKGVLAEMLRTNSGTLLDMCEKKAEGEVPASE